MSPPNATVSVLIMVAIVLSLGSFAYPSVPIALKSTEIIVNAGTDSYFETMHQIYSQPISSIGLGTVCGPASGYYGCAPVVVTGTWVSYSTEQSFMTNTAEAFTAISIFPPYLTFTREASTVTWTATRIVVAYSTTTSFSTRSVISTWRSASELTHTYFENIPAYASLGLNNSQFALVAISIIIVTALAIFYARKGIAKPHQTKIGQFIQTKPICVKCGSELPLNSKFCNICGTKQS